MMDMSHSPHFDTDTALRLYREIEGSLGMKLFHSDIVPAYLYRAENGMTVSVSEHTETGEMLEIIWQSPSLHVNWIQQAIAQHSWAGYRWITVDDIPESDKTTMPSKYTVHDEPGLTWRCTRCGSGFEAGREFALHVWNEHMDIGNPMNVLRREEEQKTLMGWSQ